MFRLPNSRTTIWNEWKANIDQTLSVDAIQKMINKWTEYWTYSGNELMISFRA